jgi:hypothetical protein
VYVCLSVCVVAVLCVRVSKSVCTVEVRCLYRIVLPAQFFNRSLAGRRGCCPPPLDAGESLSQTLHFFLSSQHGWDDMLSGWYYRTPTD